MAMAQQKVAKLRLPPLPTIRDIIRMYKLRAIKQLSQNFLLDERIIDKIVKAAGKISGENVCEVGPGPGGITRSLVRQSPARLVVVEKDPRFMPSLEMLAEATTGHVDFNIITGNILTTNIEAMFPDVEKGIWDAPPPPVHLIGNLPFSVSTILVIRWLESISLKRDAWTFGRTRMTLTFQKEVAQRMAAPMMGDQRCRLSVMCQNWCKVDHKFDIPGKAFVPKPDVDVGVVTLTPLKEPIIPLEFKLVEKVVRQIFSMRRKYSVRGAETLFPENSREELALMMYQMADVDPQIRPFQISNGEYGRLCHAYKQIITDNPELRDYNYRACKNPKLLENKEEIPMDLIADELK